MEEMRVFPRLNVACDIEYSLKSPKPLEKEETVSTKTKDISQGGICLITHTPLNRGDILNLQFRLQGHDNLIAIVGKVVWTQTFTIGGQKGYDNGIEFMEIDEKDKEQIDSFIQKKLSY